MKTIDALQIPLPRPGDVAQFSSRSARRIGGGFPNAQAVIPAPDAGYPGQTRRKPKMPFCTSPAALTTRPFVRPHWASTSPATTARASAQRLSLRRCKRKNGHWRRSAFKQHRWQENTANGAFALFSNTQGDFNTANGSFTLFFNSAGGETRPWR